MTMDAKSLNFFSLFLSFLCPVCGERDRDEGDEICGECRSRIRFIAPPYCSGCGGENDGIFDVCRHCLKEDRRPWRHASSIMRFEGAGREIIHRFKYQDDTALGRMLGHLAAERIRRDAVKADFITPVPLHWIHYWMRGYNQSEIVCRFISAETGLPLVKALVRTKFTRRQASLSREDRRKNIKGVFSVAEGVILRNRSILIVDDVLTTGVTLASAASALLDAGASETSVLTLARG